MIIKILIYNYIHLGITKIQITKISGSCTYIIQKNADHMNQNATRETFSSEIPHYSYACLSRKFLLDEIMIMMIYDALYVI